MIVKHYPGSFTDTELAAALEQFAVRRLVIAGFMTHMCCDTTARQASERGLEVIFLTDGTATRDLTWAIASSRIPTSRPRRWPLRPTASRRSRMSPACAPSSPALAW